MGCKKTAEVSDDDGDDHALRALPTVAQLVVPAAAEGMQAAEAVEPLAEEVAEQPADQVMDQAVEQAAKQAVEHPPRRFLVAPPIQQVASSEHWQTEACGSMTCSSYQKSLLHFSTAG